MASTSVIFSVSAGAAVGVLTASTASGVSVSPDASEIYSHSSGFNTVVAELADPIRFAEPHGAAGESEQFFPVSGGHLFSQGFGDRNTEPPIGMLGSQFDLTDGVSPVADGNSASYPAIGRAPLLDSGERLNPVVVIPLPAGGILALVGLGLIGARRVRSDF